MTDEQLSRAIAEKLEPLSSMPNDDDVDMAEMEEFPTECWIATFRLSQVTGMHVPSWQPRDMIHDPAMTVMLWKKLLMDDLDFWIEARMLSLARENPGGKKNIDQLGRAVAEAYARAHGIWKE